MSNFYSLINNEFKENISILDRGLSYGDGFFETMSWDYLGGLAKPILAVEYWKRHYNRIKTGCDLMAIKLPRLKYIIKTTTKNFRQIFTKVCKEVS